MACIIAVSVVCLSAMKNKLECSNEGINKKKCVSMKDINTFKKGWQQLFPDQCPEIIRTYANNGYFVFMNDIISTNEGVLIGKFASLCDLGADIEYCDCIWPLSPETIKYAGKIFLLVKEESIEKFNEKFNFKLQWQEPLDLKII